LYEKCDIKENKMQNNCVGYVTSVEIAVTEIYKS
jgi:hypothetical protein